LCGLLPLADLYYLKLWSWDLDSSSCVSSRPTEGETSEAYSRWNCERGGLGMICNDKKYRHSKNQLSDGCCVFQPKRERAQIVCCTKYSPKPQAHLRHPTPRPQRPPQVRLGTPGTRQHHAHPRHLLPRPTRHERRCGICNGGSPVQIQSGRGLLLRFHERNTALRTARIHQG
jgi:hypothetical protein